MDNLICILNGISDDKIPTLNKKTPLEKSNANNIKSMFQYDIATKKNNYPEKAFFNIIGEDIDNISSAYLKYISEGFTVKENLHVYCIKFTSSYNDTLVNLSDEIITTTEMKQISEDLNKKLKQYNWEIIPISNKDALLITEDEPSNFICSYKNILKYTGHNWKNLLPFKNIDKVFNKIKLIEKELLKHPINILKQTLEEPIINSFLLYDYGEKININKPLLNTLIISDSSSIIGAAKLLQSNFIKINENKKYESLPKIINTIEKSKHKNIILSLNYILESTYKGNLLEKIKTIEYLDKNFIYPLSKIKSNNFIILPFCHTSILSQEIKDGKIPLFSKNILRLKNILQLNKELKLM